jgi:hypothetical protein
MGANPQSGNHLAEANRSAKSNPARSAGSATVHREPYPCSIQRANYGPETEVAIASAVTRIESAKRWRSWRYEHRGCGTLPLPRLTALVIVRQNGRASPGS